jgi:hypothetical protein
VHVNTAQVYDAALQLMQQAQQLTNSLDAEAIVRGRVLAARACGLAIGAMAAEGELSGPLLQGMVSGGGDPYAGLIALLQQLRSSGETRRWQDVVGAVRKFFCDLAPLVC